MMRQNMIVGIVIGVLLMVAPKVEAVTITFDELPVLTVVDNEYTTSLGVTFGPTGVVSMFSPGQVLSITAALTAEFSVSVDTVGVDFLSASPLHLLAYNSLGDQIGSDYAYAGNGYLGISTYDQIARIVIHDSGGNFAIDNFTFGFAYPPNGNAVPVPEPSTLLLLGSGLAGLGFFGRNRRKKG